MNTTDPELEQILKDYSLAVQELIAGHKPFDDGIDANRWRTNAAQALTHWAAKQELSGRIDELIRIDPQAVIIRPHPDYIGYTAIKVKDRITQLNKEAP